ncbi:MAG: hypothetical protein E7641_03470 [Ruminococcaceae bacterium]|nr:hypothetical protein [Oscillospiraceae bacterium]
MSKDMKENKSGRVIAVAVAVIAMVVAIVLAIILLPPIVSAASERGEALSRFGAPHESELLLLTDPLYREGYMTTGGEIKLEGDERVELCGRVEYFLGNSDYKKSEKSMVGNWDLSLSLLSDDDRISVYFLEDSFYLADGYDRYIFYPEKDVSGEYSEFYASLKVLLSEKMQKE